MDYKNITKNVLKIYPILLVLILCFNSCALRAQEFDWSVAFQGNFSFPTDIVTDDNGNSYTLGYFESSLDFDPSDNVYYLNELTADKGNIYCVKLSSTGDLMWAHQIGGIFNSNVSVTELDQPKLAIDGSNNIYVTGLYDYRVDFDTSDSSTFLIPNPELESSTFRFISKYDTNGNFIWAKELFEDQTTTKVKSIEADVNGNIYISGNFRNTIDFDPGSNTYNLSTNNSLYDIFCLKLDTNGVFQWAKQLGNLSENDKVSDMSIDSNFIYMTGYYRGQADFDTGASVSNLNSAANSEDAFIAKYELSNGDFVWAKSIGQSNGFDHGYAIIPDNDGNVIATGSFRGTIDFDSNPNSTYIMSPIGVSSTYLLKLDNNGNFIWVKNFGAENGSSFGSTERPNDLSINSSNSVILSGIFLNQMDCNPDVNDVFNVVSNGSRDIFVLQLDSNGDFLWANSYGSSSDEFTYGSTTSTNGKVFLTGLFSGLIDFNPNAPGGDVNNPFSYDSFILKLDGQTFGIESQNNKESLVLSPNPATNYIYVDSKLNNLEVIIYDMNGRIVLNQNLDNYSRTILIDDLNSGIYLVNLLSDSGKIVKKLIKN